MASAFVAIETASCGTAPIAPRHPSKPVASNIETGAALPKSMIRCAEPAVATGASGELDARRRAALELLVGGQPRAAAHALWTVLAARPNDVPAFALRQVALAELVEIHKNDAALYASIRPLVVEGALGGAYAFHARAPIAGAPTPIQLRRLSSGRHEPPETSPGADEPLASDLGSGLIKGEPTTRVFAYVDHRLLLFGDRFLAVTARDTNEPTTLDFSLQVVSKPDASDPSDRLSIQHARVVGRTLFVSLGPLVTETKPILNNGYLMAVDLDTAKVLWSSEPFVSNAQSFLVIGPYIIAGFGTSHHGGALHVIEMATGKVASRLELSNPPTQLFEDGNGNILVYSENAEQTAVVALSPSVAPAPGAALPNAMAVPKDPGLACVLSRAMGEIDRRDGKAAKAELDALSGSHEASAEALRAAASFVERSMARDGDVVDLSAPSPVVATPPLFSQTLESARTTEQTLGRERQRDLKKPPRILHRRATPYTRRPATSEEDASMTEAPSLTASLVPPVAFSVPDTYGTAGLSSSSTSGGDSVLTYGNRYVAVLDGHTTRAVIDLGQVPTFATLLGYDLVARGDTLFVSAVSSGPQTELGGQKDFIAAYDLRTGARRWKTEPLISSSGFVLFGDHLITARGFGQEKAAVNVVRTDTGEVTARLPLKAEPRGLSFEGGTLIVPCLSEIVTYDVVP